MRTIFLTEEPPVSDWLAQRRAIGADRFDEVWEGEYHVAPGPSEDHALLNHELAAVLRPCAVAVGLIGLGTFNVGMGTDDYRVPDGGLLRERSGAVFVPTAALVYEIVSPNDESWHKLGFYAAHGVEEVVIADPATRELSWLVRGGEHSVPAERSALLGVEVAEVVAQLEWP